VTQLVLELCFDPLLTSKKWVHNLAIECPETNNVHTRNITADFALDDSNSNDDDDHNNSILYYLYAESTAARPIINTAQCRYT
jgi:hypothetical protein